MANPIDTKIISKLAEILNKSNLTELEYEDETVRISLARQTGPAALTPQVVVAQPVVEEKTKESEKNCHKKLKTSFKIIAMMKMPSSRRWLVLSIWRLIKQARIL
ncbi:MAG: hypothetical protein IJ870_01090 [Alphaproteobacteria bacterium]|nr:hypothetical protein [Alphaproteobacteria bacterium]